MAGSVADVYTDFQGLADLKAQARRDQKGSLDAVARQFESLLMQMMLKSMRQASLGEGLLDNDQSLFYRDMYDQQLALHLAERGGLGLADVIQRQLGAPQGVPIPDEAGQAGSGVSAPGNQATSVSEWRQLAGLRRVPMAPVAPRMEPVTQTTASGLAAKQARQAGSADDALAMPPASPQEFVRRLWPMAREAGAKIGLDGRALLAQAALETGWGQRMIRFPDGRSSHNLFGIKADGRWGGDRVMVPTLEYEAGAAVRRKAPFRAYASLRESFLDYVDFIRSSPRYRPALDGAADATAYFSSLQRAGYATDPGYADKISRILRGPEMRDALPRLKPAAQRPI